VISQAEHIAGVSHPFDPTALDEAGKSLWRRYHRTVKKVTEDIEGRFNFNTAVSAIMELTNGLTEYVKEGENDALVREVIEGLILVLSPFTPFVRRIGHTNGAEDAILDQSWPAFIPEAIEEETVEVPVQINGKVRTRLTFPITTSRDPEALKEAVLTSPEVEKRIAGKEIIKVVAIPEKMVSIVVR
jgi:leucyl-tRNA synthetase